MSAWLVKSRKRRHRGAIGNKYRAVRAIGTFHRIFFVGIVLTSLGAIAICAGSLAAGDRGLRVEARDIEGRPATEFSSSTEGSKATVIVVHGFAGSQQLMQPIAETLAHDRYRVLTFDLAGHGRNRIPLAGGLDDLALSTRLLLDEIDKVVGYARLQPGFNGRLALIGHSMASELVVRYAMEHSGVDAVVALSLFGRDVTPTSPQNLLVVDGAWEPSVLRDAAVRIAGEASGGAAQPGRTYGDFAAGTARRYVFAEGAEHIGVIFSRDALAASRDWLDGAFGEESSGPIDRRGAVLGLLLIALLALGWAASAGLPRLRPPPAASVPAGRLWLIGASAALATPLLLAKAPTDFLPILLGDYLAVHFALYGALLWAGLALAGRFRTQLPGAREIGKACGLAALVGGVTLAALGGPIDAYVTSFAPTGVRWALIPVLFAAVALAFTAEETLARGAGAPRFAYAIVKLCFVASLAVAIALNPRRLFFLIIVVPVVAVLFVVFGLVNRWSFRATGEPLVGALANALTLAWAIAVTFPLVG